MDSRPSREAPELIVRPGLCSVTFRALPPEEVVRLAAAARLESIEWGADVHVPPGDFERARQVAAWCADAGIDAASYGSYLHAGRDDGFDRVLETAQALGAPNIRVWAGDRASADAGTAHRGQAAHALLEWAAKAAPAGIQVSTERHAGTLTDTILSAAALLRAVPAPNLWSYWQPVGSEGADEASSSDRRMFWSRVSNLQVFAWDDVGRRYPLRDHEARWRGLLGGLGDVLTPGCHDAFIEFVKDDAPEQLIDDAAALRSWLL